MTGTFDENGSPTIDIRILGSDAVRHRRISAVVDTGFTGFLLLPTSIALPLGLIPHATIEVTLADGSTRSKLICLGTIDFDGQPRRGVVILEDDSAEALIGMEFLKSFQLTLIVDAVAFTVELRLSSQ